MKGAACSYCGKKPTYAKGYCRACYNRLRRNGTLEKMSKSDPNRDNSIREAFFVQRRTAKEIASEFSLSLPRVYQILSSQPQTNADRVRSMTDGELATWLGDMLGVYPFGTDKWDRQAWLDWLKKEVKP